MAQYFYFFNHLTDIAVGVIYRAEVIRTKVDIRINFSVCPGSCDNSGSSAYVLTRSSPEL